ncbi:hypothetical protein HW115_10760 [Verrucomicrobiaceae bacterium N1E253]|uniref:Uncharacterized protein n=1 Tax=Oceaniferula marina TaxID=2748318 RepID=A0A851GJP4_9BACT|nr:hypothetical protein [Oceaniferula marina]NWK56091.1 hypothetical protein [Oceaniferula marina]
MSNCDEDQGLAPGETDDESKVIQKGGARLIVSGEESQADAQVAQPREIRPEPRVAVAVPSTAQLQETEQEEVLRLERSVDPGKERIKVDKAKFEKLAARPDQAEQQEEEWGQSFSIGWKSLVLGGLTVVLVVVGGVTLRGAFGGATVKAEEVPPPVEEKKDPYAGSPEKWFRDRSGVIGKQALKVLTSFTEASDLEARSQWVRNPDQYLALAPHWDSRVDPHLGAGSKQAWDIGHTDQTAYLIFKGRNQEFFPFRAYFTREEGELKLDWQATTGWSEVSLLSIREVMEKRAGANSNEERELGVVSASELSPRPKSELPTAIYDDSVLLRCLIRKQHDYYAGVYNDREHSAYMLFSADKMHHMWGYAPKGSELDRRLKAILDHGSFVVSLKKDKRVTVKVRINEKVALPNQLDLVELVNPEWVTP